MIFFLGICHAYILFLWSENKTPRNNDITNLSSDIATNLRVKIYLPYLETDSKQRTKNRQRGETLFTYVDLLLTGKVHTLNETSRQAENFRSIQLMRRFAFKFHSTKIVSPKIVSFTLLTNKWFLYYVAQAALFLHWR